MIDVLFKALSYYGEQEVKGSSSNSLILSWVKKFIPNAKNDDDFAWCSIFINNITKELGYIYTDSALARSWLNIGEKIEKPLIGDIVVFWRDNQNSTYGHVGLYIREDDKKIWVLGGNQNNQVSIAPYSKDKVLGYRRLNKMKT